MKVHLLSSLSAFEQNTGMYLVQNIRYRCKTDAVGYGLQTE